MEKETFGSIISKVEEALKPLDFEIHNTERNQVAGGFSWDVDPDTKGSRTELKLDVAGIVKPPTNETVVNIILELEKILTPLMFEIMGIKKHYFPIPMTLSRDTSKAELNITIVRVGELA